MERLIPARAAAGHLTASVLRAGDFFGSGRGNWFDLAIVKSLATGKLVYPGPLDLPHAWAYLPDLARAFVRVAQQPAHAAFTALHFEGHTLTGAELLAGIEAAAAATLGIAPARGFRHAQLPWAFIRAVGLVVPTWRELARMAYLWRVPHALDGSRLAALPGPRLNHTPIATALLDSLIALGHAPRSKLLNSPA
jgi:nucleoside-diphosphate-sugar epimerase